MKPPFVPPWDANKLTRSLHSEVRFRLSIVLQRRSRPSYISLSGVMSLFLFYPLWSSAVFVPIIRLTASILWSSRGDCKNQLWLISTSLAGRHFSNSPSLCIPDHPCNMYEVCPQSPTLISSLNPSFSRLGQEAGLVRNVISVPNNSLDAARSLDSLSCVWDRPIRSIVVEWTGQAWNFLCLDNLSVTRETRLSNDMIRFMIIIFVFFGRVCVARW